MPAGGGKRGAKRNKGMADGMFLDDLYLGLVHGGRDGEGCRCWACGRLRYLTVRTFGRVGVIGWGVGVADAVENEEI